LSAGRRVWKKKKKKWVGEKLVALPPQETGPQTPKDPPTTGRGEGGEEQWQGGKRKKIRPGKPAFNKESASPPNEKKKGRH